MAQVDADILAVRVQEHDRILQLGSFVSIRVHSWFPLSGV